MIFSQISYPGIPLFFGTHFNLYTAPVVLAGSTSLIGIVLLICCFDGRMKVRDIPAPVYTEDVALGTVDEDTFLEVATAKSKLDIQKPKYDIIAVIVLILVKVATEIVILNLITIVSF